MKLIYLSSILLLTGCATPYVNTCHIGSAITIHYKVKVDALAETKRLQEQLIKDKVADGEEAIWCEKPSRNYNGESK